MKYLTLFSDMMKKTEEEGLKSKSEPETGKG
jgi:hypothetical protein